MAIIFTLIAITCFSLWTPMAVISVQKISVWEFIFLTELLGFVIAASVMKVMTAGKDVKYKRVKDLTGNEKGVFVLSSICRIAAMGCLFSSFYYVSAAMAISVYDFWPIIALYFAPLFITKDWSGVTAREVVYSIFATGGLFILLHSEIGGLFVKMGDMPEWKKWGLLFLPLLAGLFQCVAEINKRALVQTLQIADNPFLSIFAVDINFGFFCLITSAFALFANMFFFDLTLSAYPSSVILAILFFSLICTAVGRCALARALSLTKENIFVLWYFLPLLTLVWLWVFGLSEVSNQIVFGAAMITFGNLLISAKPDDTLAYPATIMALIFSSLYCYYFKGMGIDDYFEGVATPLIFFVLIVAFLMDRLINRDRAEENLVVEMIRHVERHGPKNKAKQRALIEDISSIVKTSSVKKIDKTYRELRNSGHKCLLDVTDKLDALTLSRIQGANFSELLVLSMVGLLVVLTALVFRPDGVFGDCFAIVLSASVCFIYVTVLDLIENRSQFFLDMDEENNFHIAPKVIRESRLETISSVVLILVVLSAMIGVMWSHHGIQLPT